MKKISDEVQNLRSNIIRSIARMNYLVTGADQEIDKIAQSLSRIEGQVLNLLST